jgi:glycolate oxidase FAD binding subunit
VSADIAPALERALGTGLLLQDGALDAADWGDWRQHLAALPVAAPRSLEEAAETLKVARANRTRVWPCGRGSRLSWHPPPEGIGLLVSTQRLAGIVSHEPADGTIAALAGTRWSDLASAAASGGHHLTPDVPHPWRSSLGGVFALGLSGADRLRFGPLRHQVLGARVMLGGSQIAKSGGQLVKNVTGFDLHRLYCGSAGRLCLVLEVALRLHAAPAREALLELECADAISAMARCRALLDLRLRPVSLAILQVPVAQEVRAPWQASVRLSGSPAALDHELALARRAWPDARLLEDQPARARSDALRDQALVAPGQAWLRASCRPSRLPAVWGELERWRQSTQCAGPVRIEPGLATVECALARAPDLIGGVRALRQRLAPYAAALDVLGAAPQGSAAAEPWSLTEPGRGLASEIQRRLDPDQLFPALP